MKKESISFAVSSMMTSVLSMFVVLTMMCVLSFSAYADKGNESIVPTFTNPAPNDTTPLSIQLVPYVFANGYNVSCFGASDGSIDLTVSGGTPPYKYRWSTGDSTEDVNNLGRGFKEITVTDKEGLRITGSLDLTEPPQLSNIRADGQKSLYANGYNVSCISCFNGSIDVSVSGGSGAYIYEWGDGPTSQDRSNLGKGEYTLFVRDASVCSNGENVRLEFRMSEPPVDNWKMTGNAGTNPAVQFVGTTDNNAFTFKTNNIERLLIHANGNIGIGTNNPTEKLSIVGNGKIIGGFNISGNVGIGTTTPTEKLTISGNAKISENLFVDKQLRIQGSLRIDSLGGAGFKLDSMSNKSYKMLFVDEAGNLYTNKSLQTPLPYSPAPCSYPHGYPPVPWLTNGNLFDAGEPSILGTCSNVPIYIKTSGANRMIIKENGNIGIGTTDPLQLFHVNGNSTFTGNVGIGTVNVPSGCLLGVKGSVYAEEYVCTLTGWPAWPDFVFDKKYELLPLNELEKYITTEKHLPNIPSATQVENDGIKLGEMNALLLQKIEELTLYMIELNKANQALQQEVGSLKEAIKSK